MDYQSLSREILRLTGGNDNIDSFTNCMTRLRLNVKDPDKVDIDAIRALDDVLGVIPGGQVQVVVGPGHAERLRSAFAEVSSAAQVGFDDEDPAASDQVRDVASETRAKVKARQSTSMHMMFRHVGNIFIPGFIAGGLIASIANAWKLAAWSRRGAHPHRPYGSTATSEAAGACRWTCPVTGGTRARCT